MITLSVLMIKLSQRKKIQRKKKLARSMGKCLQWEERKNEHFRNAGIADRQLNRTAAAVAVVVIAAVSLWQFSCYWSRFASLSATDASMLSHNKPAGMLEWQRERNKWRRRLHWGRKKWEIRTWEENRRRQADDRFAMLHSSSSCLAFFFVVAIPLDHADFCWQFKK